MTLASKHATSNASIKPVLRAAVGTEGAGFRAEAWSQHPGPVPGEGAVSEAGARCPDGALPGGEGGAGAVRGGARHSGVGDGDGVQGTAGHRPWSTCSGAAASATSPTRTSVFRSDTNGALRSAQIHCSHALTRGRTGQPPKPSPAAHATSGRPVPTLTSPPPPPQAAQNGAPAPSKANPPIRRPAQRFGGPPSQNDGGKDHKAQGCTEPERACVLQTWSHKHRIGTGRAFAPVPLAHGSSITDAPQAIAEGSIMVGNRYWMPPPRQFQPMFQVSSSNQTAMLQSSR